MKCLFDKGENICGALREKSCPGCKFAKTQEQFDADNARVAEMLRRRGLETYVYSGNDGLQHVSVRPITNGEG